MTNEKYAIFDQMIEGIQVIDSDWKYVYVNNTVTQHGKYTREELLGHTMMGKYPGIEKTEMFDFLEKCMQDHQPHHMINEFDFPDGSKGYFELRMQPVLEGVLVMSIDVTEQKRAEQLLQDTNIILDEKVKHRTAELEHKNKELEQFAYIASHDLQEPIRTIGNYINILEEDYHTQLDGTALAYLGSMKNATGRMSGLIKALLDYSRLGRGRQLTHVNFAALVKDVLSDMRGTLRASHAQVTVGEMPESNAYETEMRQVFQNLISNAVKFVPKGRKPEIHVTAEQQEDHWKFTVSDNGIGIDPQYADRIFQIFQRLHSKDEFEGHGIGLANTKKLIELHEGKIFVESAAGEGSKFVFTIPKL